MMLRGYVGVPGKTVSTSFTVWGGRLVGELYVFTPFSPTRSFKKKHIRSLR